MGFTKFLFSFISLILIKNSNAGRILFGYAPQAISHFRTMMPLIHQLAKDGHEITIFHTHEDSKSFKNSTNFRAISVPYKPANDNLHDQILKFIWGNTYHGFMMVMPFISMGEISTQYIYKQPIEVRDALNNDWDAIILCSLFNLHTYAFAEILARERNIPYIIFHSTAVTTTLSHHLALGHTLSYVPPGTIPEPENFDDSHVPSRFSSRLINVFEGWSELLASLIFEKAMYNNPMQHYGVKDFSLNRFIRNAHFVISDMPDFMSFPTTQVTDYRPIGAYCAVAKSLTQEFLDFIEDPKSKGTIYIAFGTVVPWNYAPEEKRKALFDALDELTDYRIIFSYKGNFPDRKIPPHLRLVNWAPQFDLLAHPKTQLFITHGGLKSFKEGICARTPMLVMPVFAEQARNAKLTMKLGIGGALNKYTLSRQSVLDGVHRILQNADKYKSRSQKIYNLYIDRPISDLVDGSFYISRLIRLRKRAIKLNAEFKIDYKSKIFFKRKSMELNTMEILNLEILVTLLILCFFLSYK